MAKIVGIDYGTKRVGVAVTDEEGRVAFPKAVLPNDRMLLGTLSDMISTEGAEEVIIGESRNNQGQENSVARSARAFADNLARVTAVTIHFEPEFYSSQEVRTHTGGYSVDAAAAAVILNSFLTKRHGTYD